MNNKIKDLASRLEQEINWVEQLNLLLSEEKMALTTRQFDALEELANKKQALSDKIEESAKQRVALTKKNNQDTGDVASLKEFLKSCTSEENTQISTLNNKLAEVLTICQDLNNVNGQVIVSNIHTRQQIVKALSGNTNEAVSVYTATGNLQSTPEHNHHQEA
ncbi:flagella synthesis protein FlgN [Legionella fallonii]|uniref:Putative flagella synthesis protein FlgN n=1 Tax=Legionella fallonii LLAP-10 TaxID=1212491 RepID=A0A098G1Q6_9GAMM|nr:flagellar protein FlgN [Legionella fallonii]CEG56418.1 Putative flagella synthesis protein FlgN [Legionella fallonii LLAP-10]